ncbi:BA14K family protein [Mesorhizobium sp. KR9-304]|uniref:BA14K family protein n=1 Tax=Mesorhizobium sp. KR9-304 TaxID=3156614 RepID=UPI0032B434A1
MKCLQTCLVAATIAAASALQATAAPIFLPQTAHAQSDVIQVRDGWYRGYRGYRNFRYGYRSYNGWWYPAGAFIAGAVIGGAIANSNYYGGGYYNSYYDDGYYPRYYQPRYYAPVRDYYPQRGTAYRQGYRDGFRDGVNARYRNDITCTSRLADAGMC